MPFIANPAPPPFASGNIVVGGTYVLHKPGKSPVDVRVLGPSEKPDSWEVMVTTKSAEHHRTYKSMPSKYLKPKKVEPPPKPAPLPQGPPLRPKKRIEPTPNATPSANPNLPPKPATAGIMQYPKGKRFDVETETYMKRDDFILKYGEDGIERWKDAASATACPQGCISERECDAQVAANRMYDPTEKDAYDRFMTRVDFNTQMREVERLRKKLAKRAKETKSPKKAAPAPAPSGIAMPDIDASNYMQAANAAREQNLPFFRWNDREYERADNPIPHLPAVYKRIGASPAKPKSPKACKDGKERVNGRCVAVCSPPKYRNDKGRCVSPKKPKSTSPKAGYEAVVVDGKVKMLKICEPPKFRDPTTQRCRSPKAPKSPKAPSDCKDGKERINGRCVARCVSPKRRDSKGKCVETRWAFDESGTYTREEFQDFYGEEDANWYWRKAKKA